MSAPEVQQLEVKLELADGATVDQAALIPIFHRWIQEDRLGTDARLIDVADYRHVPGGPGVMLIADGAQWRMDEGGRTGLVYARKRDPLGEPQGKLEEAFRNLLRAAVALEAEPALGGTLRFAGDRALITVMSRRAASGDDAAYQAFAPAVRAFAARLWGDGEVEIGPAFAPREPLAVAVRAAAATPAELLARLT